MYKLKTEAEFDSAHFLKDYDGKCANIHGHRWKVCITVKSDTVEEEGSFRGMIVDFKVLKKDLKAITENLDHSLIVEKDSLRPLTKDAMTEDGFRIIEVPFRPTAENFARYFFEEMTKAGYMVSEAAVYETPKNVAIYSLD